MWIHTTYVDSFNKLMKADFTVEEVAQKAKMTVALLLCVAILWGTESLPLSLTNLLVATIFYIFAILPKNAISQAYMNLYRWGIMCGCGGRSNRFGPASGTFGVRQN